VHLAGNTYPSDESDYDENVFRSVRVGDWRASADASGVCAFDALPPEVIRRQQRDRRPRRPDAARGDRAREVRRQRGNLFYQVRYDGLVVAGAGVPAGASAETAVPAGHVVVECQWRSTSETKEIDLDVGKDAELVFGSDGG